MKLRTLPPTDARKLKPMEHPWTNCYRMRPYFRNVGLIGIAFCAVVGVVSTLGAYVNIDGSFAHPKLASLIFGLFWSAFVFLGVWLLLLYYQYRLFVNNLSLRQKSVLFDLRVDVNHIDVLKWRRLPEGGSVHLSGIFGVLKIELGNFNIVDRGSIVVYLRHAISETRQTGWQEFCEQFSNTPEKKKKANRFNNLLMLFFAAQAVVFGIMGAMGAGVQYVALSAINATMATYMLWTHRRKRTTDGGGSGELSIEREHTE